MPEIHLHLQAGILGTFFSFNALKIRWEDFAFTRTSTIVLCLPHQLLSVSSKRC